MRQSPVGNTMRSPGMPRNQLAVPSALQSLAIEEGEEDEPTNISVDVPIFRVTRSSHDSSMADNHSNFNSNKSSRASSIENLTEVPEDTSTTEGLQNYLRRMIEEGKLPGSRGMSGGMGEVHHDADSDVEHSDQ